MGVSGLGGSVGEGDEEGGEEEGDKDTHVGPDHDAIGECEHPCERRLSLEACGQWLVVGGRWSVVGGRWSVVGER